MGAPGDYGIDPVAGQLGGEYTNERTDRHAGTVYVHFPRTGYQIESA